MSIIGEKYNPYDTIPHLYTISDQKYYISGCHQDKNGNVNFTGLNLGHQPDMTPPIGREYVLFKKINIPMIAYVLSMQQMKMYFYYTCTVCQQILKF